MFENGGFFSGMSNYLPYSQQTKALEEFIWKILKSDKFKSEMSNYIRVEVDKSKYKRANHPSALSYDELVSGSVNMQARMAANGYDVYGRTIISDNNSTQTNTNAMKKMKNRINYGRNNATNDFRNKGSRSVM